MPILRRILPCLLACVLAGCSGGTGATPVTPRSTSPGAGTDQPKGGNATGVPALTGKLLETSQSTLELISGGKQTAVARASSARAYLEYPAFAPDGQRMVYVLAMPPSAGQGKDWGSDIYLANIDGSNAKVLLKHDAPGATLDSPSFTPDGDSLIFAYTRALYDARGRLTGLTQRIERLALATGTRTTVLDHAFQPAVSWDGSQLVYLQQDPGQPAALAIANIDGSQPHRFSAQQLPFQSLYAPHFSPDGRQVVFAAAGNPFGDRQVSPVVLSRRSGILATLPEWLRPAAAEADGVAWDVWTIQTDGMELRRLTALQEDLPFPLWLADGKTILFLGARGLYTIPDDTRNSLADLKRLGDGVHNGQIAWCQC